MNGGDWKHHLQSGEEILWQGRPDGAFVIEATNLKSAVFNIFLIGFAVFWMAGAAESGGTFWMFGLLIFFIGLARLANSPLGGTFRRRQTWHTLTNRRAFIATNFPLKGRGLKSDPITPDLPIDYVDGTRPTIYFASETKHSKDLTYERSIGFERIEDAPRVLEHIRKIQQGDA